MKFFVVNQRVIKTLISENRAVILDVVRSVYEAHAQGKTVNPPSHFLRFPSQPMNRIIALPAYLEAGDGVAGIKWIASFPKNIEKGIPRASATLILNEMGNGYPYVCMEASEISAARTAASASLGAVLLSNGDRHFPQLVVVGAGPIAVETTLSLLASGCIFNQIDICDLKPDRSMAFQRKFEAHLPHAKFSIRPFSETHFQSGALVLLATVASEPHIFDLPNDVIVLNISLRDISPELILQSYNMVDDIEHVMKANTSVHLAEQSCGHRRFIHSTIGQVLVAPEAVPAGERRIFSPFGMGILDLAVGRFIFELAQDRGLAIEIPDFFDFN